MPVQPGEACQVQIDLATQTGLLRLHSHCQLVSDPLLPGVVLDFALGLGYPSKVATGGYRGICDSLNLDFSCTQCQKNCLFQRNGGENNSMQQCAVEYILLLTMALSVRTHTLQSGCIARCMFLCIKASTVQQTVHREHANKCRKVEVYGGSGWSPGIPCS